MLSLYHWITEQYLLNIFIPVTQLLILKMSKNLTWLENLFNLSLTQISNNEMYIFSSVIEK